MKKLKSILAICAIIVLATSCGKDGDPGAQGPTGPAGPQGPGGVYYQIKTVSSWAISSTERSASISASIITSDIYNYGAVMVYVKNSSSWESLPRTYFPYGGNEYTQTWRFMYNTGQVTIKIQDDDLTTPSNPGTQTFKIICLTSERIAAQPGIDLSDYAAVQKAFDIPW